MALKQDLLRFLARFSRVFAASTRALPDEDRSTRFIFAKDHFVSNAENSYVKANAFLPNPNDGMLSMFRTQGIADSDVWNIGADVSSVSGRQLRARGDIRVGEFGRHSLTIDFNNDPPGHFDVGSWPEEKAAKKSIAQQLAQVAVLRIPES